MRKGAAVVRIEPGSSVFPCDALPMAAKRHNIAKSPPTRATVFLQDNVLGARGQRPILLLKCLVPLHWTMALKSAVQPLNWLLPRS